MRVCGEVNGAKCQSRDVRYAERTLYRLLPQLLDHRSAIESAALRTARDELKESFGLVLYDVTTLYFESFNPTLTPLKKILFIINALNVAH